MSDAENSKEELIEFIGVLRQRGYNISTEQCVSAHRLLSALAAQDEWPDPQQLGQLLAPLLCSTREEQDLFPRFYEQWLSAQSTFYGQEIKRKPVQTPTPQHVTAPKFKDAKFWLWLNWWGWAAILGLGILITIFSILYLLPIAFPSLGGSPPPALEGNPTPSPLDWVQLAVIAVRLGLLMGVAIVVFVVLMRLFRQTFRLGLKKWRARKGQSVYHIRVRGASEQIIRTLPLRRVAQDMRRYMPLDETDIDVKKTVEETIRAGIFTPAFTSRKAMPEYLVLIDSASFADQQAQLVDNIVTQLIRNDVPIERYFFQEDPRTCWKDSPKAQFQTIQELALKYPRHYLIIFTDGSGFFNPLTGRPHHWLESFSSWPIRLLLTSEVQAGDYRDWVLTELGFRVLPTGRAGLAAIGESFAEGILRRGASDPLPPLLREGPSQWLKTYPPQPEVIAELCRQLKAFLGKDGYYWLSACAVYPLLYLDLTFYLGERLLPKIDLFGTYSKLVRLPWFRSGSMPDWLRGQLIFELDTASEQAIRSALEDLLIDSLNQPDGFILPVVTAPERDVQDKLGFFHRGWVKLRNAMRGLGRRQLAKDILRTQFDDGHYSDYVAVTFISGDKPNKLVLKLPAELYSSIYPHAQPVIDSLFGWMLLIIVFLASPILLTPALTGTLPAIVGSLIIWSFFMWLNVWSVHVLTREGRFMIAPAVIADAPESSSDSGLVSIAESRAANEEVEVDVSLVQEDESRDDYLTTENNKSRSRYFHLAITGIMTAAMIAVAVALWRGIIPIDWLASLGYKGIFILSLLNGIAPIAGPSQIATFFVASKLNPLAVGIASGVGGAIGELAGYAFGYSLRASQSASVEHKLQRLEKWRFLRISRERSFIPLFILASIPNPFFDPASAIAGSLRIGLRKYFTPVLLGKTVRHLIIAYAGYYAISTDIASVLKGDSMLTLIESFWFVAAVMGIALVAWLVRSFSESDPDPLLSNLTFFAFAGQCFLAAQLGREANLGSIQLLLLLFAVIVLLLQTITIRAQAERTIEHYTNILQRYKIGNLTSEEIEGLAAVLVRITGVDFYPEFYRGLFKFGLGPRDRRRRQALFILRHFEFKTGEDALTVDSLTVPTEDRRWLWRAYAFFCFLSWSIFIASIVLARGRQ